MDSPTDHYEAADLVTKRLGLPSNFVFDLLDDDDWSFIIKSHALMEAAAVEAIKHRLSDHTIDKFLKRLQMGKCLDFAQELQAIDDQLLKKIRLISKIRNDIIHDVTKYAFSLTEYLSNTDKRNEYQGVFLREISGSVKIDGHNIECKQLLIENPKLPVIFFLIELLVEVYLQEPKAMLKSVQQRLGESILKLCRKT